MNKKKFEVALETLKERFVYVATNKRVLRISHNFEKGNPIKLYFWQFGSMIGKTGIMKLAILLISRISILRICGKAIRRTRFPDLWRV